MGIQPRGWRLSAAGCVWLALALTGCSPAVGPSATPTATPTPSPSATVSAQKDLTKPGAALEVVRELISAAGTTKLIMVEVDTHTASISVVQGTTAQTWAYRGGTIKQVQSDTQYVDQAIFDINDFDIFDVGALFRAAAAVSGVDTEQSLQIVDFSAGEVMMTVSTVPESRTVFFHPDGTLLPTLDFNSRWGIREGLADAIGSKQQVIAVGIDSSQGVYVDYVGPNATTLRRLRSAKFPAATAGRSDKPVNPDFDPNLVSSDAVWTVIQRLRDQGKFDASTVWSVMVDDRRKTGTPLMYFNIAGTEIVADLSGNDVTKQVR